MVMEQITFNGTTIKIHERLKKKLDNIIKMQKKEWDAVFLIDGMEGSGKSTLAMTCAWYLSKGTLSTRQVCTGTQDAIEKLEKFPDKSVLIIDEGDLLFSSKEVMRREQKNLIKILKVIRQKKMCLIIVAPIFFELNRYISVHRSRFLLHVYTKKNLERGRFIYFGEKRKLRLYHIGKKNFNSYNKPKSNWNGDFYNFNPFGEEYLKMKKKSLMESFDFDKIDIAKLQRDVKIEYVGKLIEYLRENKEIKTVKDLIAALKIGNQTLHNYKNAYFSIQAPNSTD